MKVSIEIKVTVRFLLCLVDIGLMDAIGLYAGAPPPHFAELRVRFEGSAANDTLLIDYWGRPTGIETVDLLSRCERRKAIKDDKGFFKFRIDSIAEIGYFSILESGKVVLSRYMIEPGDDVQIDCYVSKKNYGETESFVAWSGNGYVVNYERIQFNGSGSTKYNIRYLSDKNSLTGLLAGPIIDRDGEYQKFNGSSACLAYSLALLSGKKRDLSNVSYDVLKADFIGEYYYLISTSLLLDKRFLKSAMTAGFKPDFGEEGEISDNAKRLSMELPVFFINKAKLFSWLAGYSGDYLDVFHRLKDSLSGEFRDRILYAYIEKEFMVAKNPDKMLEEALKVAQSTFWKKQLEMLDTTITNGSPGYNFQLKNEYGRLVSLGDFAGKVVFIDFWFTGCFNCVNFYKEILSNVESHYKMNPGIVFLTVSVDTDENKWIKSVKSGKYTSPDSVINLYTGGLGQSHPLIAYYHIGSYPHPMLFDRSGRLLQKGNLLGSTGQVMEIIDEALKRKEQ